MLSRDDFLGELFLGVAVFVVRPMAGLLRVVTYLRMVTYLREEWLATGVRERWESQSY